MKRYSVIRVFSKALSDDDVGIFIGDGICKEAFQYDRQNNFYTNSYDNMLGFSLGVALGVSDRVFVFCDDSYFIRNVSEAMHIAVSKCNNIYLIVLVSGYYMDIDRFPTIYNSVVAPSSMMFDMGFLTHNYTRHFNKLKNPQKEISSILDKTRGPMVGIVEVDFGLKKCNTDYPSINDSINRLNSGIIVRKQNN